MDFDSLELSFCGEISEITERLSEVMGKRKQKVLKAANWDTFDEKYLNQNNL